MSLKTQFTDFIAEAEGKPFDIQVQSWINLIESQEPEIFYDIYGVDANSTELDSKRKERLSKHLPRLFSMKNEITSEFNRFEKEALPVLEKLVDANSDADLSNVVVFAIPSLMRFNGQVSRLNRNGNSVMAVKFGLDMISFINKNPTSIVKGLELVNDLPVLVTHEFTHALHNILSGFAQMPSEEFNTLLYPLWQEGIAQYNSLILVPGTRYENMFMEKKLAENCTNDNVKKWTKEFLEDIKQTDEQSRNLAYGKWFKMNPSLDIPRAGYCLGYHVVLAALQNHTFDDLLRLPPVEIRKLSNKLLTEFLSL